MSILSKRAFELFLIGASGAFCFLAIRLPKYDDGVEAGSVPLILSSLLLVSLLALLLRRQSEAPTSNSHPAVWIALIATAVYLLLIPLLGFFVSSALFVLSLSFSLGYRRLLVSTLSCLLWAIGIYVVFSRVLKLPLPQGLIF